MSFSVTYATLSQMLEDWPVTSNAAFIANLPNIVGMGELRLLVDLNLDIFDQTDSSETLAIATRFIDKPAGLVQVRSIRLAVIASTSETAPAPTALCLAFAPAVDPTVQTLTGALGPAPATISPPAQISVTQSAGANGVAVVVTGTDQNGVLAVETVDAISGTTQLTLTRFSQVSSISTSLADGSGSQSLTIGTAAVTTTVLGESWPVVKRSKDFCDACNADPALVGRPKYFNEYSQTQWEVALAADQEYGVVLHYIIRPESIVDANETWLGDNCGELLFIASLMEAERFLKADDRFDDMHTDYQEKLQARRAELRDSIRVGDYTPVKPAATVVGK